MDSTTPTTGHDGENWRDDPLEHTPVVRGYQPKRAVSTDPTNQTTERPLGRWHRWWLAQFKEAYSKRSTEHRHSGGIAVHGYEGTAQGRALAGLMQRGLIAYEMAFEGGMTVLRITGKGLAQ